ncbi:CLUMA_CG004779, isoform A [Clunio marinus]|uniref:CLUMA_CG004779, isoform A n=1 Tax=Clunio marinus TaxID=568069 RepID=A0A1J1HSX0_9DIPT|nr:CLUMA_CG004779, isoform A [Clunio marinus]
MQMCRPFQVHSFYVRRLKHELRQKDNVQQNAELLLQIKAAISQEIYAKQKHFKMDLIKERMARKERKTKPVSFCM